MDKDQPQLQLEAGNFKCHYCGGDITNFTSFLGDVGLRCEECMYARIYDTTNINTALISALDSGIIEYK